MPVLDEKGQVFRDLRGAELEVGDTCIYFKTGKYPASYVVEVVGFKNKVRIGEFDSMRARSWQTRGSADEQWAESSSLIKVLELPQVEGRKNVGVMYPKPVVAEWIPAAKWVPSYPLVGMPPSPVPFDKSDTSDSL